MVNAMPYKGLEYMFGSLVIVHGCVSPKRDKVSKRVSG